MTTRLPFSPANVRVNVGSSFNSNWSRSNSRLTRSSAADFGCDTLRRAAMPMIITRNNPSSGGATSLALCSSRAEPSRVQFSSFHLRGQRLLAAAAGRKRAAKEEEEEVKSSLSLANNGRFLLAHFPSLTDRQTSSSRGANRRRAIVCLAVFSPLVASSPPTRLVRRFTRAVAPLRLCRLLQFTCAAKTSSHRQELGRSTVGQICGLAPFFLSTLHSPLPSRLLCLAPAAGGQSFICSRAQSDRELQLLPA